MTGTISFFDEEKLWGLIARDDHRGRVFFHVHAVRLDQLGKQLPRASNIGSNVEFQIVPGRDGKQAALDVTPYEPFADPVDLAAHRELSTIVHWVPIHRIGIARRQSGDWIAVSHRDVITTGMETLKVGSQIWHSIGFRDGFNPAAPLEQQVDPKEVVQATQVEICLPEARPAPVTVSLLLAPRLRTVKLRNIRIRKTA